MCYINFYRKSSSPVPRQLAPACRAPAPSFLAVPSALCIREHPTLGAPQAHKQTNIYFHRLLYGLSNYCWTKGCWHFPIVRRFPKTRSSSGDLAIAGPLEMLSSLPDNIAHQFRVRQSLPGSQLAVL